MKLAMPIVPFKGAKIRFACWQAYIGEQFSNSPRTASRPSVSHGANSRGVKSRLKPVLRRKEFLIGFHNGVALDFRLLSCLDLSLIVPPRHNPRIMFPDSQYGTNHC